MGFVGSAVLPYATQIVKAINTWFEANKELIEQKIEVWAQKLGVWFGRAWEAVSAIVQSVQAWYEANKSLVDESIIVYLKGLWEVAKGIAGAFELVGKAIGWAAAKIVELIEKGKELKAVRWVTGLLGGNVSSEATTSLGGAPGSLDFGSMGGGLSPVQQSEVSDQRFNTAGDSRFASFQTGTGPAGLPQTGLFYGHQGEIVKSPEESDQERQGADGGDIHIHLSTVFGDRESMRRAAMQLKSELRQLDHRWGTA